MAYKLELVLTLLAAVNIHAVTGLTYSSYSYGTPYAYSSPANFGQNDNILRTLGNLVPLSTYSKSISNPNLNVAKYDPRLSNRVLSYAPYANQYALSPAYKHTFTAPFYSHTYPAPAYTHGYVNPTYATLSYAHKYASPIYGLAAQIPTSLFGISYSAAPASAHFRYSNGYGINYSY